MKKYLMTGIAALAMCAGFTSCSHDLEAPSQEEINVVNAQKVTDNYNRAFIDKFGQPAEDQDWGFGSASSARALTRTITVNGDAYDKFPSTSDVAANFPTKIPEDAKTDEEIEAEWKGKNAVDENGNEIIADWGGTIPMWDLFAIYKNMVGKVIKNIKVTTPGEFSVGNTWANPADRVYNVYIAVGDGNKLTLKRNGAEHVNFYIMNGEVTIDSSFGECGGIISVAEGATVIDQRNSIAHNDGIKIYNKGTYNSVSTTKNEFGSTFDIGNFCTFYNEGKFTCVDLSYSPGDANTSYFVNLGDKAELTAASMTLNSAGNFFNSGKATITGETNVTQKDIYWVNDGYYETGSMVFSAKNATFYNYCQLIVTGNAHMYDGEFNLMENSYTEAGTAEFDNFIVNMGSNTGMNIKGAVKFEAQGDGTYQGFRTNGSNDYLLIDGKVTVACHKKTFSISSGITYSIKEIEIVRNGVVVTEAQLQDEKSGDYPVLDLNGTECPYGQLTVTRNTTSCGATWNKTTPDPDPDPDPDPVVDVRIIGEDLTPGVTDWDFNDVVFDVKFSGTTADCTLLAAGGTLPLRIYTVANETNPEQNYVEVHDLFGVKTNVMVNTGGISTTVNLTPTFTVTGVDSSKKGKDIIIKVNKGTVDNPNWVELTAVKGQPAAKLAVTKDFTICTERQNINDIYERFKDWVNNPKIIWY